MARTKTEYREYIASEEWQARRKEFLQYNSQCNRCTMPRWLASIVYDQDLNVHHLHYKSLGCEQDSDLEALCRRCHELETFGRSDLREPPCATCECCGSKHYNPRALYCESCKTITNYGNFLPDDYFMLSDPTWDGHPLWQMAIWQISYTVRMYGKGDDEIIEFLAKMEKVRESLKKCPA